MDSVATISNQIKRFCLLDSDYDYSDSQYGHKIIQWLNQTQEYTSIVVPNSSVLFCFVLFCFVLFCCVVLCCGYAVFSFFYYFCLLCFLLSPFLFVYLFVCLCFILCCLFLFFF
jgi:hypothetical protein